jgi:hypothetical protein
MGTRYLNVEEIRKIKAENPNCDYRLYCHSDNVELIPSDVRQEIDYLTSPYIQIRDDDDKPVFYLIDVNKGLFDYAACH